jgi:hypothetical protein
LCAKRRKTSPYDFPVGPANVLRPTTFRPGRGYPRPLTSESVLL